MGTAIRGRTGQAGGPAPVIPGSFLLVIALLILAFAAGCAQPDAATGSGLEDRAGIENPAGPEDRESQIVNFVAEIRWIDLEGGFYAMVSSEGKRYLPLNLPEAFRREGLKVEVRGRVEKVVSFRMWGTALRILEIHPR